MDCVACRGMRPNRNLPLNDNPPQIINIPIRCTYAGRADAAFPDRWFDRVQIARAGVTARRRHDEISRKANASSGTLFCAEKLCAARAGSSQQGRIFDFETLVSGLRENGGADFGPERTGLTLPGGVYRRRRPAQSQYHQPLFHPYKSNKIIPSMHPVPRHFSLSELYFAKICLSLCRFRATD